MASVIAVFLLVPRVAVAQPQGVADVMQEARGAGVCEIALTRLVARGYDRGLQRIEIRRLLTIIVQAAQNGVPHGPLVARAEEGLAKGVLPADIEAGLQNKIDDLRFITRQAHLNGLSCASADDTASIVVIADSLDLGLERADLRRLFHRRPLPSLAILAVGAETQALLAQLGFSGASIAAILEAGFAHETLGPAWRKLAPLAARAQSRGLSQEEITRKAVDLLRQGGDFAALFAALGFTPRDIRKGPSR
jgi:hypothetical protein